MKKFLKSFLFALNGIKASLGEVNLRIHLVVALLAVAAGLYCGITEAEWLSIVFAMGLVISTELINTAIEHLVNLVSPQHQPAAGKVKDIAAGAVLVSAVTAAVIGLIVFAKYII